MVTWKKINTEKDLPANKHFKKHTEFWMCKNGLVFKGYFYNAYGGKNYSLAEYDSDPFFKCNREFSVEALGEAFDLDAYMPIERPLPLK